VVDAFLALPPDAWRDDHDALMRREKVVFSRTLARASWPNTAVRRDLVPEVSRLKRAGGHRLRTWGSLSLVTQLLTAGLVDRLRLVRFPLVADEAGRQAAFATMASCDLELVHHEVLDDRLLLEEYHPTGRDIPRALPG